VARARLTKRRLVGLDRSGGPPPETRKGQPLNPWTIPNAIGFVRLALLPVFLVIALRSGDGRSTTAVIIYAVVAWSDYADGMAARITGQYSRLGALLDPLTDRALVISGAIVCWKFELLPRWALLVLAAREAMMLVLTELALRHELDLNINMLGRWAVWPTMSALFFAMVTDATWPEWLLYLGLAMTIGATVIYFRDGIRELRRKDSSRPSTSR
jgi:CDP-diacylglycerol--glycerol-3-phosphate 3-phosphatidyltransferase